MEYLIIFAMVLAFVIVLGFLAVVWGCCSVAKTSDEAMEKWSHQ